MSVWIVGAGPMGVQHALALRALGRPFTAVGRSEAACAAFEQAVGEPASRGGLTRALASGLPDAAIVAVGVEALSDVTAELLRAGVRRVLVEKPAGLDAVAVQALADLARDADVHVAYNRRTYDSVLAAKARIAEDGGAQTFRFEFTEWASRVAPLQKAPGVKEAWFFANSSHVVDLAFHLGGRPATWARFSAGSLPWHPRGSRFAGAGVTDRGALFDYTANWESGGRWGLEVTTARRRLVLAPLEELAEQAPASVAITKVEVPAVYPGTKPGVATMLAEWLDGRSTMPKIAAHAAFFRDVLEPMLHGAGFTQGAQGHPGAAGA